jgi:hypothetical protein
MSMIVHFCLMIERTHRPMRKMRGRSQKGDAYILLLPLSIHLRRKHNELLAEGRLLWLEFVDLRLQYHLKEYLV